MSDVEHPLRRLKFSLRVLLLAFLVLCVVLGAFVSRWRNHRAAIFAVRQWDSDVIYDYQVNHASGTVDANATPAGPPLLTSLLGPEWFIDIEQLLVNDKNLTDGDLVHLNHLPNIKYMGLNCPNITDDGLQAVARCQRLKELGISNNSNITDAGLQQVSKIRNLKELSLDWLPSVTDAGRQQLKDALSDCTIKYSHVGESAGSRTVGLSPR